MNDKDREKIIDIRINEILGELNTCREDDRNAHTRILEVIGLVGTILGILFGAAFFSRDSQNNLIIEIGCGSIQGDSFINGFLEVVCRNMTYARVVFLLSILIFCAAFSYIIRLGMSNALRYYYIQTLEERLYNLEKEILGTDQSRYFPDDEGRGWLLHWNEYAAPIMTLNLKHITSTHTGLHFLCYMAVVVCLMLFSFGILIILFLRITPKKQFDYLIITIVALCILISFLFYFRFNLKASRISKFAWDMAHENQKKRLEQAGRDLYGKAKSFWVTFFYFLYPRKNGLLKSLFIVAGFAYRAGSLYGENGNGADGKVLTILNMCLFWFVFEFLVYQARYQINDIRGLDDPEKESRGEKQKEGEKLRAEDILISGHVIKISRIVIFVRIIMAGLFVWFCTGQNQCILLISLISLVVITVLYETARKKQLTWLVFTFVGLGYPLRFFVGYFSVEPLDKTLNSHMIWLALTLWAYGVFATILAWAKKVTLKMQQSNDANEAFVKYDRKKHYRDIQKQLEKKFDLAKEHRVNGNVLPLRESGRLRDYWNIFFMLSLLFSIMLLWNSRILMHIIGIEIFSVFFFYISIYLPEEYKVGSIIIGTIILAVVFFFGALDDKDWLVDLTCVFGLQLLIIGTFFVLGYRCRVQIIGDKILGFLKKTWYNIWGCKAMELLQEDKEKNK